MGRYLALMLVPVFMVAFVGCIAWFARASEAPSEVRSGGRLVATIPAGQEIVGFDYLTTQTSSWVTIRYKRKETKNEQERQEQQ